MVISNRHFTVTFTYRNWEALNCRRAFGYNRPSIGWLRAIPIFWLITYFASSSTINVELCICERQQYNDTISLLKRNDMNGGQSSQSKNYQNSPCLFRKKECVERWDVRQIVRLPTIGAGASCEFRHGNTLIANSFSCCVPRSDRPRSRRFHRGCTHNFHDQFHPYQYCR